MATLRELIAKVVFRADPSKLKEFDAKLDATKAKLGQIDAKATKGIRLNPDASKLVQFGKQLGDASKQLEKLADKSESTAKRVQKNTSAVTGTKGGPKAAPVAQANPQVKDLGESKLLSFIKSVHQASAGASEFAQRVGISTSKVSTDLDRVRKAAQGLDALSKLDADQVDVTSLNTFAAKLKEGADQARTIQAEILRLSRTDPSNPKIGELQGHLTALRASTRSATDRFKELGVTNLEGLATDLNALTGAANSAGKALKPSVGKEYAAELERAEKRAATLKSAIAQLATIDPKNPKLEALRKQLDGVEKEATQARNALSKVVSTVKAASAPTGGLISSLGGLSGILATVGIGFGFAQVTGWIHNQLDAADATGKLAARLGESTDELQVWQAFTAQSGASTEDLSSSVKTLARNIETVAKTGKGPAADAFHDLDINTKEWNKTLPDTFELMAKVGGALGDLTDDTKRVALAQLIMGEGALKLLPGFKNGTKATQEQIEKLRELTVVYSKEFIESAEAANDELDLLKRQMNGVSAQMLLTFLPGIRSLVQWITPVVKDFGELTKTSKILQSVLTLLGIRGLSLLITKLGGFSGLLRTVGRLLLRFAIPLLVIDDILSFLDGKKSVLGVFLDKMLGMGGAEVVLNGLKQTWNGLGGAIQAVWGFMRGDESAIQAGMARMHAFGNDIEDTFSNLGNRISDFWNNKLSEGGRTAFKVLLVIATGGLGGLFLAWQKWGDNVLDAVNSVWAAINSSLDGVLDSAANRVRSFLSNLPLIGNLLASDSDIIANAKTTVESVGYLSNNVQRGLGTTPAAVSSNSTKTVNVNYNDHSTSTIQASGVTGNNLGATLRQGAAQMKSELKRDRRQVLRQVVGAAT